MEVLNSSEIHFSSSYINSNDFYIAFVSSKDKFQDQKVKNSKGWIYGSKVENIRGKIYGSKGWKY